VVAFFGPWVREEDQHLVQGLRRELLRQNFNCIVADDPDLGEPLRLHCQQQPADAGPMNLHSEVVALGMGRGLGDQVVTVTKADLEGDGRLPAEGRGEIEGHGLELDAVARPEGVERSLLCFRDPTPAHHEGANGTRMFYGAQGGSRLLHWAARAGIDPDCGQAHGLPLGDAAGQMGCRLSLGEALSRSCQRASAGRTGEHNLPGLIRWKLCYVESRERVQQSPWDPLRGVLGRLANVDQKNASRSEQLFDLFGIVFDDLVGSGVGHDRRVRARLLGTLGNCDSTSPTRSGARDPRFVAPGWALTVAVVYLPPPHGPSGPDLLNLHVNPPSLQKMKGDLDAFIDSTH